MQAACSNKHPARAGLHRTVGLHLAELGLRAGAHVRVMERAPFNGPVHVLVNEERTAVLGREQAALIVMLLDSGASA